MANQISYFTSIYYQYPKNLTQKVHGFIEDYCYLGGKIAYVIAGEYRKGSSGVEIRNKSPKKANVIFTAVKIISWATGIIPLLFFACKALIRATHAFHVIHPGTVNLTFPNGDTYTGGWLNDKKHGEGVYTWKEQGKRYKGVFLNDQPQGKGTMIWKNGTYNKGEFVNGEWSKTGTVKRILENGIIYEGSWVNGKQHGYGVAIQNGVKLDGYFDGNKCDGRMTYSNGAFYEGKFKDYKWLGVGKIKLIYTNGDVYTGAASDFKANGYGIKECAETGNRYEGGFVNGKYDGTGTLTFSNGDIQQGKFSEGKWLGIDAPKVDYINQVMAQYTQNLKGILHEEPPSPSEKKDQLHAIVEMTAKFKALLDPNNLKATIDSLPSNPLNSAAVSNAVTPIFSNTSDGNISSKTVSSLEKTEGIQPQTSSTVKSLMEEFTNAWVAGHPVFDFEDREFNVVRFAEVLSLHAQKFSKKGVDYTNHFGFIEKVDLDPAEKPQIYMRADLHGDLKSLLENIRTLQEEGHLDKNYKCKPGVHLVFLGDYCDRGNYGTQILEMLMCLREENPEQIHLIRGNHEYADINHMFGGTDAHLMEIVNDEKANKALTEFYETMSLTTYFSVGKAGDKREYVQCTHGLFELSMDPAPLLDKLDSVAFLPVPKERKLSERVSELTKNNQSPLFEAAQRIQKMVNKSKNIEKDMTVYNWGDVAEEEDDESTFGQLGNRQYALNARDIKHYFDLSSEQHRVMMLFRGHQHKFQHLMHEDSVLVTTLPVAMDNKQYKMKFGKQPDRAYIIDPRAKVQDWQKMAMLREYCQSETKITASYSLTSSVI